MLCATCSASSKLPLIWTGKSARNFPFFRSLDVRRLDGYIGLCYRHLLTRVMLQWTLATLLDVVHGVVLLHCNKKKFVCNCDGTKIVMDIDVVDGVKK